MPFCPKCRVKFQDDVEICPDCGVELIPRLRREFIPPGRQKAKPDPLFLVATAPNEVVGGLWKGILEDNGISCVLKSDNARSAQYMLLLNQWQQIWVLKSDIKAARAIINPLAEKLKGYPNYGREGISPAGRSAYALIILLALVVGEGIGLFASTVVLQHLLKKAGDAGNAESRR